jgi:hypothetical protein
MENIIVALSNFYALRAINLTNFGTPLNLLIIFSMETSFMYHIVEKSKHYMNPKLIVSSKTEKLLHNADRLGAIGLIWYSVVQIKQYSMYHLVPYGLGALVVLILSDIDYFIHIPVSPKYHWIARWWFVIWHSLWHICAFELLHQIIVFKQP